jgi:hypothetical protein
VLPDQTAEETIWQEWLSLYLEACRRRLRKEELLELAVFLEAAGQGSRPGLSRRTAAEGKCLVEFLAGIADRNRRSALVAETIVSLRRAATIAAR